MRVSTAFRNDGYASTIQSAQARMDEAQNRVTTGKRIEKPSDDPTGTRTLIGISSLRTGLAGYNSNLNVAQSVLNSSEDAYSDMGDLVQQAQTLAVQGATSTNDSATLNSIADQIASLQKRLVTLGNSQSADGRYVFGGRVTDSEPFSVDSSGNLVYGGDNQQPTAETGPGETMKVGETGGNIQTLYATLQTLQSSLRSGDITAISNTSIADLKTSGDAIVSARGDVGRRLDDVTASLSTNQRRDTDFQSRATDVGEVDYASAIVEYTAAQNAYQASLQVVSKGFSMSLMDFIK